MYNVVSLSQRRHRDKRETKGKRSAGMGHHLSNAGPVSTARSLSGSSRGKRIDSGCLARGPANQPTSQPYGKKREGGGGERRNGENAGHGGNRCPERSLDAIWRTGAGSSEGALPSPNPTCTRESRPFLRPGALQPSIYRTQSQGETAAHSTSPVKQSVLIHQLK